MPQMIPPAGNQMLSSSGGGLGGTPLLYERQSALSTVGSMGLTSAAATEIGSGTPTSGIPSSSQQPTQQQRAVVQSQQVVDMT